MIAPMRKVYVASRAADRQELLDLLGRAGVVHVVPVDPARAGLADRDRAAIDRCDRALQALAQARTAGEVPDLSAPQAVEETLQLARRTAELNARLATLHRLADALNLWGDMRLEQMQALQQAGIEPVFAILPTRQVDQIDAEFVHVLGHMPRGRSLAAIVHRTGELSLPPEAQVLPKPQRDRASIRAEAAEIDGQLRQAADRLTALAHLQPKVLAYRHVLETDARCSVVSRSGLEQGELFALQGWVPQRMLADLERAVRDSALGAAITVMPPAANDQPPTLLAPPFWARPIGGLLKMLGTVPGYREFDVSPAFMIALPVFAAMLIGDGGYGLVFLLLPLLLIRKASRDGRDLLHLAMVFGLASLIWGVLINSFFGLGMEYRRLAESQGLWGVMGKALAATHLLSVSPDESSQRLLERLTFTLGAIHLSAAHLWRARARFPDIRFLSSAGWAIALWGVYGLVNSLVLGDSFAGPRAGLAENFPWPRPWPWLAFGGLLLAVAFASPSRNVVKGFFLGLLNSIFPAIATLSDIISYVRLMAIGLAGAVLAVSFNTLAMSTGSLVLAIPILLAGHALNIALALIALFAHGVRLNILEFSNNLGMEWSGYSYEPFALGTKARES